MWFFTMCINIYSLALFTRSDWCNLCVQLEHIQTIHLSQSLYMCNSLYCTCYLIAQVNWFCYFLLSLLTYHGTLALTYLDCLSLCDSTDFTRFQFISLWQNFSLLNFIFQSLFLYSYVSTKHQSLELKIETKVEVPWMATWSRAILFKTLKSSDVLFVALQACPVHRDSFFFFFFYNKWIYAFF